jgi:hypothetical protein
VEVQCRLLAWHAIIHLVVWQPGQQAQPKLRCWVEGEPVDSGPDPFGDPA